MYAPALDRGFAGLAATEAAAAGGGAAVTPASAAVGAEGGGRRSSDCTEPMSAWTTGAAGPLELELVELAGALAAGAPNPWDDELLLVELEAVSA